MKRCFLIPIIAVLILVSVNWFKKAHCQTLDDEEYLRAALMINKDSLQDRNFYASPQIYGHNQSLLIPPESPVGDAAVSQDQKPGRTSDSVQPFGYDLFNVPSELSVPPDVADLSDYILGPGDNIIIYLWGKVEKEYDLTVDRQGKIFIPKIGEMVAWGLTLEDFKTRLTGKLSSAYSDFVVSVSLGKIRSIRIYLTGEIKRPGAYTVSSLTTLFNALYMAGGPNQRGSMRNIQLIRNNRLEATLDLYQFLLKGDSRTDLRLSSGDAIFVPITGARVSISGEVKRPAIYELKGGETVCDLLELAGGPTAEAYLERIMLDRISPEDEREIIDLSLYPVGREGAGNIELIDGDVLTVFSLYDMKRNVVSVCGMVKHPGQFERNDSTTLRSVIQQAELLPENVYYERANLFRRHPDRKVEIIPVNIGDILDGRSDIGLQDLDSLYIYSIDEVRRTKYVYIDGEVKNPGQYFLYDNMTVSDLIFLAGNLNKKASRVNVELARTDSLGKVTLLDIDLTQSDMESFTLAEDDRVFVRSIPDWFLHRVVTVEGEVRFPGKYALRSSSETLYGLIQRAGGFSDKAFTRGLIFRRRSIGENLERQNLHNIISNSQPLKEDSLGNIRRLDFVSYDPDDIDRIIIDIDKILSSGGRKGDITLQSNDYIYVPQIPSGITVLGAVGANGTIKYSPGKTAKYYIECAGNFTNQADRKATRLIRADGQVFSGGGVSSKKIEMGDTIVIPTRIQKDRDWLKIFSTTASIIGGIATTAFVIDRL
jgi:polysaccharide export outer membrane protein